MDSLKEAMEAAAVKAAEDGQKEALIIEGIKVNRRSEAAKKAAATRKAKANAKTAAEKAQVLAVQAIEQKKTEGLMEARRRELRQLLRSTFVGRIVKDKDGNTLKDANGRPKTVPTACWRPWSTGILNRWNLLYLATPIIEEAVKDEAGFNDFKAKIQQAPVNRENWDKAVAYLKGDKDGQ